MKQTVLFSLLFGLVALLSSTAVLSAKGKGKGKGREARRAEAERYFERPKQGALQSGLTGTVKFLKKTDTSQQEQQGQQDQYGQYGHKGSNYILLETAEGPYLLPPNRDLAEGASITVDGYILEPKEGVELPNFDYEGKKVIQALAVTMASDADGNRLRFRSMKGSRRGYRRGKRGHRGYDKESPEDLNRE